VLPEERIRLALFGATVATVAVAAAGFAVDAAWRRRRGRPPPRPAIRRARAVAWFAAALGLGCALYGRFVEPRWLDVVRVTVAIDALPPGAAPIVIAHISDVHAEAEPRLEVELADRIAAARPDLIVFTGDSLNERAGLPTFRRLMTRLAGIAPTFAVRGNWDAHLWHDVALWEGTGAVELDGAALALAATADRPAVWIAGATDGDVAALDRALAALPAGAVRLMLYHHPDELDRAVAAGVDLYCAGHTHGGQVALPWYGALVTYSRFGKRYEAGLYRERGTALYVNRGLGMEGGPSPRVRFFARPELTLLRLVPATR
jgi:hypothetical protein